jgi:hypothetical protein
MKGPGDRPFFHGSTSSSTGTGCPWQIGRLTCRVHRHGGVIRDDLEQRERRTAGRAPSRFPMAQGRHGKPESMRELRLAQAQAVAEGRHLKTRIPEILIQRRRKVLQRLNFGLLWLLLR